MERLNNDMKQIRVKYGIILTLLAVVVCICTGMLLGRDAETLTYALNCTYEEHLHSEDCYIRHNNLICEDNHEHDEQCFKINQILSCESHPHQHTASCFRNNVPEGIDDVMGKAQAYAQSIEIKDYNNETMTHKVEAPVTFAAKQTENIIPLDMSQYELMALLEYYDSTTKSWVPIVSEETIVPVNEKIRLTYHFQGLRLISLKAAGGYAIYQVPDPLRNNIADGGLEDSDSNKIATVTRGDDNSVLFAFDNEWIQRMIDDDKISLSGDFKLIVDLDPKVIGNNNSYEIVFEKSRIEIKLEEDWRAKQSIIEVVKSNASVIETDDGAYFEYTIEVTASKDGTDVEDITITDTFTDKRQFISKYVGVESSPIELTASDPSIAPVETKPSDANSGSVYLGKVTTDNTIPKKGSYSATNAPGTLVWHIDEMKAGETRTLTYRAKASDALILTSALKQNAHSIKNKANVFAKEYLRDSSESVYTTNNNFTSGFHNKFNQIITDANGNQYIRFKLLLEAKPSNDFNYRNLRIRDELFPTHGAAKVTEEKYRPYLTLEEDSFRLYSGNVDISAYNTATQIPIEESALTIDQEAKMFELNLGTFEPGECITLIYDVKIDKGAYTLSNNDFFIANTFITLNGNDKDAGSRLERLSNVANFKGKIWSRKSASEEATASITNVKIGLDEEVYDAPNTLTQNNVSEFDVPSGAFKYFIIFNEDGKWDLSNATLTDTLGEYLRYSGYVKVNAYQITNTSFSAAANADYSVVENFLKTQPLIKTVWMKIDGKQSFTFEPKQIGLDGRYAYTLEYCAIPYGIEDVSMASVSNTFTISGNVGDGVYVGGTGSIMVEKFVTITGQETFGVRKQGWYYEKEVVDNTSKHWINGRLYWVVELEGTLKAGREIKDVIPSAQQIYCGESVIGIYKGNLAGKSLEDYTSVADFEKNANVEKLQGMFEGEAYNEDAYYTVDLIDNLEMHVTLNKNIPLKSNEFVYMIFAAEPKGTYVLDYSKLDIKTYNNSVYSREDNESGWVHMTDASYNIASKGPVYKVYDGTTLVNKDGYIPVGDAGEYRFDKILKNYVSDSGVYSEWYVNLNWNGEISGVAKMSDILPAGTELVYVRMFEIGSDYDSVGLALDKPICLDIPELQSDEWQKNTVTALENNGTNILNCTYYYNKTTNEVRWDVGNLASSGAKNERNVMFQIVTKAVSDELLLTSSEVTMNNTIKVVDENGKETIDTAFGTYQRDSLTKDTSDAYKQDDSLFGNKIPFVIDVNSYGVDMNPKGNTLTIVDEPSSHLVFDTESIKVYEYVVNNDGNEEFENIAAQAKVSTTGTIDGTGPVSNLTDKKDNTLFKFHNSQMTSQKEVVLSFNDVKLMNKFRIAFEKLNSDQYNYQFNFSIFAQNSAENEAIWDTIASNVTCNRTTDFEKIYTITTKEYDKIKIVMHSCTTVNGSGWPAIAEFEVYGKDALGTNVSNDYLNKTISELPLSEWNAAIETKEDGTEILKITIPDDKWLKIEYTMEYRGPKGETVSIYNNVKWDGMPKESGSSFENTSFQYDIFGTVITNDNSGIKIIKVDENNLRHYLQGAKFSVTECSIDEDGSFLEIPSTKQMRTTDENGIAYFSSSADYIATNTMPWMKFNTVYCLREETAPKGYVVNSEPMYFVIAKQILINGEMTYPKFPDNVYVYTEKAIYEYTCRNSKGKISVDKKFYTNENNQVSLMDGTYTFGLYNKQNPTSEPLQILKMTFKDGTASYSLNGVGCQTPSFSDIDVDTTTSYYIYELDSQNKPVQNSSFVKVDGATYQVFYPDDRGIEVNGSTTPVKEIHNYLTFKLPESGGNGTVWYIVFGFALILLSVYTYIERKRNGRRFQNHL